MTGLVIALTLTHHVNNSLPKNHVHLNYCHLPVMWSRDRGLGLETVSRPKKCGLGLSLGLECTGLGLGLERCGLDLKGVVLVLGIWSRSFAFGLDLAPLVWPLVETRVEYLLKCRYFRLFRDF